MRCWPGLVSLILFGAAVAGCTRQCFVAECDYHHYQREMNLPANLEQRDPAALPPEAAQVAAPPTVLSPEQEPYFLTLNEAIAMALEHGTSGVQSSRFLGVANTDLVQFTGRGLTSTDNIRVLALDPAVTGTGIASALARFDPLWTNSMNWSMTDEPPQGLNLFTNGQNATFSTSLAKLLPTGGMAGITLSSSYLSLTQPPSQLIFILNNAYTTRLQFGFEQPLLRDFGVETNQLLGTAPFSTLFTGLNNRRPSTGSEGILISRIRFDQSRAEFERNVNYMVLNVETAYWNLYGAYVTLYAADQALRQSYEAWTISKNKFEEGQIDLADFAPTRAQYEQFRGDRLQALEAVLEAERTLRLLMGLSVNDGKRLVPIDAPTMTPYQPDWKSALEDALNRRPELILAREEVKVKQLGVATAQNFLKPDLRFSSTYSLVGLGQHLDGTGQYVDAVGQPLSNNSLRVLASDHFNDWSLGLTMNTNLGYRQEHALLRQARLQLAQSYMLLKDQEMKAQHLLAKQYSGLLKNYKLIEARRAQREAFGQQVQARFNKFVDGKITIDFLLESQRQWANALSAEYQAIVEYNNALARFEFARGTILRHDNIQISEGPLPQCAQVRAVEHERERSKALVLRERAARTSSQPTTGNQIKVVDLPAGTAPTLLSLFGNELPPADAPAARLTVRQEEPQTGSQPAPPPEPPVERQPALRLEPAATPLPDILPWIKEVPKEEIRSEPEQAIPTRLLPPTAGGEDVREEAVPAEADLPAGVGLGRPVATTEE